jgi:hypothetical protein
MINNRQIRVGKSDATLSIAQLFLSGVNVRLDDWAETILLDDRPIVIPGNNQFVLLPSEIGLQPPNFFASYPYTGMALYEEYNASNYLATGWSCSLRIPGSGPTPLTGAIYIRSLYDPFDKKIIAPFYIESGNYYSSGLIPETRVSGDCILGWDIYSGLNNAEDLSVSLRGRYHDIYESNISQGVIMSSGDAAISFFLEFGAITGQGVLEYYSANQFVATRWGVYSMTTGFGTLSIDPFTAVAPLSGRFYYRDPKNDIKYTIAPFSLNTGKYANWLRLDNPVYIPFRRIVGIDIYNGINDLRNLNIVLGGRSISSANYFRNVVTQSIFETFSGDFKTGLFEPLQENFDEISGLIIDFQNSLNIFSGNIDVFSGQMTGDFYYLSGFLTGLLQAGNSGITSLNNSYGDVDIDGVSGIEISKDGYPSQNITVKYTSGNFENIDFAPQGPDFPYKEGRLYYSDDTKTLNAYLDNPDITLNIGQEQYVKAVNGESVQIDNGQVVYISGHQGNRPKVWLANASDEYHRNHLIGVATHNITANQEGYITTFGIVRGVDTRQFENDSVVYLSEEIDGGVTGYSGIYSVKIGYALNATNNGSILVKI